MCNSCGTEFRQATAAFSDDSDGVAVQHADKRDAWHHRAAPYGTLFSDIDTGAGLRMFESAGAFGRGPHTGAWTTFWNLRGSRDRDRFEPSEQCLE